MLLVLKDQQQLECQCSKLLLEPPPLLKMLRPHQRPSGRQPGSDLQSSHVTRHCFLSTLFTLFFHCCFWSPVVGGRPPGLHTSGLSQQGGGASPSAICCRNQQLFLLQSLPSFFRCYCCHLVATKGQRSGSGPCVIRALLGQTSREF